ncbi:MAG: hypothetical protein WAM97_03910 [Acidimicrobiales bacterium]
MTTDVGTGRGPGTESGIHGGAFGAVAGSQRSPKRRGRGLHAAAPERAKRSAPESPKPSAPETTKPSAPESSKRGANPVRGSHSKAPSRTRRYMVLAGGPDDIVGIDQTTGAWTRLRVMWPADRPRLQPFELIEVELAEDPERDDMAHPEAVSVASMPEVVGKASKRSARRKLKALVAPTERNLLGFAGSAAPYWEFRGMRPSLALVCPALGPLLFRRQTDGTTWARFGWARSDNWLPVEDPKAIAALWATQRPKLTGKDLAGALGFRPRYLLVALSPPRDGHCYKTVLAMLPRP